MTCIQGTTTLPLWISDPCVMGIDEAGRGPVLGAMVYGSACCRIADMEYLAGQKYADSKTLNEAKRESLFEQIKADEKLIWAVDILSPSYISANMLRRTKRSLNAMSHDSASGLIRKALDDGVNVRECFVDTVGDADKYQEMLSKRFPSIKFVVAPKADSKYPIVSAASIAAKVTRDHGTKNWEFEAGIKPSGEIGSGYPSDPITQAWLVDNLQPLFGWPGITRFSWGTLKPLVENNMVEVCWEADLEDDVRTNQKLSFGGVPIQQAASVATSRHSYFKSRKMQRVATF